MLITPTFKGNDKVRVISDGSDVRFEIIDNPIVSTKLVIEKGLVGGICVNHYINDFTEYEVVERYATMGHPYDINGKPIVDEEFEKLSFREKLELVNWKLCSYGVADTIEQILKYGKKMVDDPERMFVIGVSLVSKKTEPKRDGWRWEKWGSYIGIKKPQADYLADEPEIEEVLIFDFIEVKKKEKVCEPV